MDKQKPKFSTLSDLMKDGFLLTMKADLLRQVSVYKDFP